MIFAIAGIALNDPSRPRTMWGDLYIIKDHWVFQGFHEWEEGHLASDHTRALDLNSTAIEGADYTVLNNVAVIRKTAATLNGPATRYCHL